MRRIFIKFFILATVMVGGARYAGPPQAQAICANCTLDECGGSCGSGYRCTKNTLNCYDCTLDSTCGEAPTPTRAQDTPTPVPIGGGGGGGGGSNITPTNTPAPTTDPSCVAEPGFVTHGTCRTPSDCSSSTSTVTCDSGSCKYSGNLKPCPNAGCPKFWVPGGWSCNSNRNGEVSRAGVGPPSAQSAPRCDFSRPVRPQRRLKSPY